MAAPRQARRIALALAVSLTVNAAMLGGASMAFRHSASGQPDFAQAVIPVSFVPPIPPPKPATPARSHARPPPKSIRAPVVSTDDMLPMAPTVAADRWLGQLTGVTPGPTALTQLQAPPDLVDPAVTPAIDAPAYPVNPGYWQVNAIWLAIPVSYRICLEPRNITRFLSQPCNHVYTCAYSQQSFGNGKAHFVGVFSNPQERYDVRGGGDYAPTAVHLSVVGAGHYHILPVAFFAAVDARYLGPDCPADARRLKQP